MTTKKNTSDINKITDSNTRCEWVSSDPLYLEYHDKEWGVPQYDNQKLFEKICLEGQQAGLSWITVLKKREGYRKAFHCFNVKKIAKMTDADIDKILTNPDVIRHRKKLEAIIKNAKAYLLMQEDGEDFSQFIWSFVSGKPIVNQFNSIKDVPACTAISDEMAKALKKRGFAFVGSTTCYAFMQSMGLVNDHTTTCFCRQIGKGN